MYRIDVQYEINVQVGKFLKNNKRAGQNKRAGGKLFRKSINVQGKKNSGKSIILQVEINVHTEWGLNLFFYYYICIYSF